MDLEIAGSGSNDTRFLSKIGSFFELSIAEDGAPSYICTSYLHVSLPNRPKFDHVYVGLRSSQDQLSIKTFKHTVTYFYSSLYLSYR